jgi:uncharacterized protein (TIGR02996 family)
MISTYPAAFLGAILDDPADDSPRLVYADWLDEHGEPDRAEFIRLQCELEQLPEEDPRLPALARRERELRRRHAARWAGHLAHLVRSFEFRRGFVEAVEVDAGQLLRYADTLFRLAPLRCLRVHAEADQFVRLADCPRLERITALDLALQPCPESEHPLVPGGLKRLLDSPHLTRLTSLRLRGLRPEWLPALARSRHLGRLTRLDLAANHLGVGGLAPLLDLRLPALEDLRLGGNAPLDRASARRLAGWPSLARLRTLDLSSDGVGPADCAALAASAHLGRLTALHLGFNHVGDPGASALARWPHPALRRLYLARNQLGPDGVRALASSPHLAGLTHLDLDYNDLPAEGLKSLAASPHLRSLKALYLRCGKALTARLKDRLRRRFGEGVCRF